jgi:hypothetical protein
MDKIEVNIRSGDLNLAASGSFVTTGSDMVHLTILDNGAPLYIFIQFVDDSTNQIHHTAKEIPGKNAFEIIFHNFNNPLGTYTKEPWKIGNSYNKELFFCYVIKGYDSLIKKIDYSFYLGKEVTNG